MQLKSLIIPLGIVILLAGIIVLGIFTQKTLIQREQKHETIEVNLFFGNTLKNPEAMDCQLVYPVQREVETTPQIAQATLEELLKGLTEKEKTQGYITGINQGVEIKKISIENGILKVDFNSKLEEGIGGSCLTATIRSQITQTLKQFPTVKEVIISIDGRIEDILQP